MEHEQQSDLDNQDHHQGHEMDATLEVSHEPSYESHGAHEDPQEDPQPQQQPQQMYPQQQFQPRSPAPPPPRPQPNPQYYPQAGYASAHPVQAPPQNCQAQTNPQGYTRPHQQSHYNPNAGAPGGYQNGGYGEPAQGVQMQRKPATGYMVPQPQYQMSSYGNNPGTVGWTTGLFDCCCPCITFGQIAEIVDNGQTCKYLLEPNMATNSFPPKYRRSKMRTQYDLLEVPAADWLTHCFCECCALSQEYRELRNRGLDPALGWHGNMMRNQNMQPPQDAMMPPVNQNMASQNLAK